MSLQYQAVRGMNDILPEETPSWQALEYQLSGILSQYGYQEIRFPVVESAQLFLRSVGQATDIVEKEMYVFDDHGEQLCLRPEGTAGCVRAGVEHGLLHNQVQRLWYMGPMFRHERPQKGRYRQFYQLGVEAYGMNGPDIDVEILLLCARMWRRLGIESALRLEINTLGNDHERAAYRTALIQYFEQHSALLDADTKRRLYTNPLRILDSKNPAMQDVIATVPVIQDYLEAESQAHFSRLCDGLSAAGIAYHINPRLVRGIDYYNRTVFEWVTDTLGAQGTVCAGGHYDGLVAEIGGKATPAIGFAMGLERLLEVVQAVSPAQLSRPQPLKIYLVSHGEQAWAQANHLAEQIRDSMPAAAVTVDCVGASMKSQFKRADKSGADYALVIGEAELAQHSVTIKALKTDMAQQQCARDAVITWLQSIERKEA